MHPMMAASQSKDPLVKSTDIPILFNHLTELVQLSDNLIIHFESTNVNVGYTFQTYESDLVVFLKYVMHYKINIKPIKRACNNVLFVKIDQETCSQRDTNRLGMSDYFIAPIQRIPRYCLLIRGNYYHLRWTLYANSHNTYRFTKVHRSSRPNIQRFKPCIKNINRASYSHEFIIIIFIKKSRGAYSIIL